MKIKFPNGLPVIGAVFGLSVGAGYYLSIMISQFFIGRPSSTWILGVFWLPIFILKPGLIGLLVGFVLRVVLKRFYGSHEMTAHGIKVLKIIFVIVIVSSVAAGTWKIIKLNETGELKRVTTSEIQDNKA